MSVKIFESNDFLDTNIPHPPYVEYKNGFSHDNLPGKIFRVSDYRGGYHRGVRNCHLRETGDRALKYELIRWSEGIIRLYPELKVVRIGWLEGNHYYESRSGGLFGGRSCHSNTTATCYVDFEFNDQLKV